VNHICNILAIAANNSTLFLDKKKKKTFYSCLVSWFYHCMKWTKIISFFLMTFFHTLQLRGKDPYQAADPGPNLDISLALGSLLNRSRIHERTILLRFSGHNLESFQTCGFRTQCLHYKPVSNHALLLKGGDGVKSVSRGGHEYQGRKFERLLSQLRPRIRPLFLIRNAGIHNSTIPRMYKFPHIPHK
jgi:hypothetical protein